MVSRLPSSVNKIALLQGRMGKPRLAKILPIVNFKRIVS